MPRKYTAQEMRIRAAYEESANANAKTASMLHQAADVMEREERRYEYAVEFSDIGGKWEVYKDGLTAVEARKLSSDKWARPHRIVRRTIGEWEEVPNEEV